MSALNKPGRRQGQDCNRALGQLSVMPRFEWERQMHAMPLDRTVKLIGFVLAQHADKNGQNARPGVRRLMWACDISDERTVSRALAKLREIGLIWLAEVGGGRGKGAKADVYWLTTHDQADRWAVSYEDWRK